MDSTSVEVVVRERGWRKGGRGMNEGRGSIHASTHLNVGIWRMWGYQRRAERHGV